MLTPTAKFASSDWVPRDIGRITVRGECVIVPMTPWQGSPLG
jgi:hypothetical protein